MGELKRPWGSNFSKEEIEKTRANQGLLSLELEMSRKCNLRCVYCYAEAGEELDEELSLEEIFHVVDQAVDLGAQRIIVLGGGEPLMYPHLVELLEYIHGKGVAIDLFTNGTDISPELARTFLSLGVSPVIKLNSLREEVQDALAGQRGTYQAIQTGLKNLFEAGYPHQEYSLGIQSVICSKNIEELPGMWVWARDRDIVPYFEMITWQGRVKAHKDLYVSPGQVQHLFEKLSRIDREQYGLHWDPHPPIAALSCNRHGYTCTVACQGDVMPCPGVNIPLGNIRKQPLADILKGSSVIQDLRSIREKIKGACKECEHLAECYGCRGSAYQLTGDYLAADPLCWKNPEKLSNPLCQNGPVEAEKVIPHEKPMRLVDAVVHSENGSGSVETQLTAENIFVDETGKMDPVVAVELIAQAYAAVKGIEHLNNGGQPGKGYLVGIKRMEISGRAQAGDRLLTHVRTAGSFEGFAVVEGEVQRDGQVIASGSIKLWVPQAEMG